MRASGDGGDGTARRRSTSMAAQRVSPKCGSAGSRHRRRPMRRPVYAELRRRYDEPFRQYHNLHHILDCLRIATRSDRSFLFRHRVCDHVLATRHSTTVSDPDRRFLVDIDLSGFGAPWDEFMRNGALLREESSGQNDIKYHYGQVAFLSRLQERRHFFATEYFRARYETTARENLRRVLAELRAKGYGTTAPPNL